MVGWEGLGGAKLQASQAYGRGCCAPFVHKRASASRRHDECLEKLHPPRLGRLYVAFADVCGRQARRTWCSAMLIEASGVSCRAVNLYLLKQMMQRLVRLVRRVAKRHRKSGRRFKPVDGGPSRHDVFATANRHCHMPGCPTGQHPATRRPCRSTQAGDGQCGLVLEDYPAS